MTAEIKGGMTGEHCHEAMNDIFNDCIAWGYASGTWETDPNLKEWYWGWFDPGQVSCQGNPP